MKAKTAMLGGAVLLIGGAVTCSVSMAMPKPEPWLTAIGLVGFLVGLGVYLVGRVAIWWRE